MDRLLHDIRIGLRSLRRTPGFVLTAILTLALGIGLSTAVFTVADALLLRRLPVHDQDRLVVLWGESRDRACQLPAWARRRARVERQARSVERVALFPTTVIAGPRPRRRPDLAPPPGAGVRQFLRCARDATHDRPSAAPGGRRQRRGAGGGAELWCLAEVRRRRPRPRATAPDMHDDGVAYTIVGVMPQGLDYPRGTDFWAAGRPLDGSRRQHVASTCRAARAGRDRRQRRATS